MHETKLASRLIKCWRQMGAEVLNIQGGGRIESKQGKLYSPQNFGWPDIFLAHRNWSGFIEFKGAKTVLQAHQARIIKTIGICSNVWVVRFAMIREDTNGWLFELSDSNLQIISRLDASGTDGQVAAQLLKELVRLD